jgi:hypothetical protein
MAEQPATQGGGMAAIELGNLLLSDLNGVEARQGITVFKCQSDGHARLLDVSGPERLRLSIADIQWRTGEREVRAEKRFASPQRFDQLVERVRLGVRQLGGELLCVDLMQARLKSEHHCNLFVASAEELDAGAGIDVRASLTAAGAAEVATRAELLGDDSTRRNALCVTFPEDALLVPAIAFVLTRVAPVLHRVPAAVALAPRR